MFRTYAIHRVAQLAISALAALFLSIQTGAASQPVPPAGGQPAPELGERVDFSLLLEQGKSFAYRTRMELRVEQSLPQAALAEQVLTYDITTRFTVQSVEEDGSATLAMRVTAAKISVTDGEDEVVVELPSEREEGEEFASAFHAALANTVVTMVVSPEGEMGNVLGADAYLAALEASDVSDPRLVGFLTADQIVDTFQPLFTIEELNGKPRRVGTAWSTLKEVELPPVAVLDMTYNWKFQGVLDALSTLTASVETTIRRPNTPDPARPTVVIEGSSGNVVTQWNRDLQAVTRRISTLRLDTQWALGDLQVGMKQLSVLRIEREPEAE